MAKWAQVIVSLPDGTHQAYRDVDEIDTGEDQKAGRGRGHLKVKRGTTTPTLLADITAGSMLWVCVENPPA